MGRIASAFSLTLGHRLSPENPNIKLAELQQFLSDIGGGGTSDSGTPVTQRNSVRLAAVWRCVRVLSGDVAALPLFVLERQQPRGRRRASEHPLHRLLHLQPNPWHSSYTFRGVLMANALLQGNGYAAIRRDRGGRIRELWPIPAARVEPKVRQDGSLFYEIRLGAGAPESWENSEILHVPGLGFDGVQGMSVLSAAREAIGTGLSLQKYGATLFRRGGRIPGVIQTPHTKLDDETRKNVRAGWDASVGGPDNWLTPAVFPKGWEWKEIGIKPNDGQWLESKKFSVLEICRFFGVNPHRVYDFDRATFTNFEHSSLSHTVDDLTPWLVNFEQEMNRKLLTEAEQERFFVEFSLQGRMRGDTQTRGQFYALLRQWGAASANDIREFENMPDLGPKGDVYLTPINMENSEVVAGVVRAVFHALEARGLAAPRPAPALPPARAALPPAELRAKGLKLRRKIRASQRPIIEDRASTIVRREIGAIEKELKQFQDGRSRRAVASLRKAIDDFYSTHGAWATSRMEPVLQSYAGLIDGAVAQELGNDPSEDMPAELERFTADYSQSFGKREASEGRLQLLAVIDEAEAEGDEEVVAALQQRLDEWGDKRAGKIGLNESVQFMAAAAKTLYVVAGVQAVRWVANAGACPFCQSLDGKTSSTENNFVNAGQGVDGGEGTDGPLRPSDNIGHPPLHGNCECDLVAD
jgi:HK97 family phage portal protein